MQQALVSSKKDSFGRLEIANDADSLLPKLRIEIKLRSSINHFIYHPCEVLRIKECEGLGRSI